ncbi:MAG: amidohydrolase family protein, partial [bacterium]|nr:amidohydrolase family protein [bacterium]
MKIVIYLIICTTLLFTPMFAAGEMTAIKAGKIVTVSGETIENGVILLEGERIKEVGKNVVIPSGTNLLDYTGDIVYPGLINAVSTLGLSGTVALAEWNDFNEKRKYNPMLSADTAFYPWSNLIPVCREFGTLIALTAPTGGVISGKAALVSLDGWSPEDMFIKREAALMIKLPRAPRKKGYSPAKKPKTNFSKAKKELKTFISKAYKYYLREKKGIKNPFNPGYDAVTAIWKEQLPVIITATAKADITFAIKLGKEFKLNLVLFGIYEGEALLEQIKASGYPVILDNLHNTNSKWEDGYDIVLRLPAALARQGIPFAFSFKRSSGAFNLPVMAARAVAYGLSPEETLKALTLHPARILGIEDYGSIAAGKIANLVVTDGNILETSTRVKA